MKQVIRKNTFETNSSSYHTISIIKNSNLKDKLKVIKPNEDLVIDTDINIDYLGDTSSYVFTARTNYEKAQVLLRYLASELDNQLDELFEKTGKDLSYNERQLWYKEHFYETPLIKAFIKAIKKYIGEDNEVEIKLTKSYSPFIEQIWDEATSFDEAIGVQDLNDVDLVSSVLYSYIFEDDFLIRESCESNE